MKNEKRPWNTPKVQIFGTVTDLTRASKVVTSTSDGFYLTNPNPDDPTQQDCIPLDGFSCGGCP